jgi:S-adenosylmethionine:tRNA ribosyltransferase-isomerase
MRVDLFDFELPPALIAQRPIVPRDAARLLRVTADGLTDSAFAALPELLNPGDLLVFNDTRVIPARLTGRRGDVRISLTLHQRLATDRWSAFARPAKRLRIGDEIMFDGPLAASVAGRDGGLVELVFDRAGDTLMQALSAAGRIPLPPYIRGGEADAQDTDDYQTIFARHEGAVAAPTAALHFTPAILDRLTARGIETARLTLHVGAGTFLPVKADDTNGHAMHGEIGMLSAETATAINACRARAGRVVAVGTTSLRLIETAADQAGRVTPWSGETKLFLTPGSAIRAVDMLLTNFHLPRSTLFMLVASLAGLARMQAAYAHAIARQYRFYSYGDCCLIDRVAA